MSEMRVYTEKDIPTEGWYWWVPKYYVGGNSDRFIRLDDITDLKYMQCKAHAGKFVGPIHFGAINGLLEGAHCDG